MFRQKKSLKDDGRLLFKYLNMNKAMASLFISSKDEINSSLKRGPVCYLKTTALTQKIMKVRNLKWEGLFVIDLLCNKMTGGGSLTCKVDRVGGWLLRDDPY